MEKKKYLMPSITELEIETEKFIAGSNETSATSGDYDVVGWDEETSGEI